MPRRQQYIRENDIHKLVPPEDHPNAESMAKHLRQLHYRTTEMQDWLTRYGEEFSKKKWKKKIKKLNFQMNHIKISKKHLTINKSVLE